MKTLPIVSACSALILASLPIAGAGTNGAYDLQAVGKVVALDQDSMVLKLDEHGHRISFAIGKDTRIASGVEVGSHVRLDYHATGTTGQMVDEAETVSASTSVLLPPHPEQRTDMARSDEPQRDDR